MSSTQDKSNVYYMIASRLCLDVETPMQRLADVMETTARRYVEKGEGDGMLAHCDAMELAEYMECFTAQLKEIMTQVSAMVTECNKQSASKSA